MTAAYRIAALARSWYLQAVRLVAVLGFAGLLLGACKGDPVKCDQGCRNFARLTYPKWVDEQIAEAAPDKRDALRKELLGKFDSKLEAGIDMCVSQCQSANNSDDIDCMIAAKTADQVRGCFK